MAQQEFKLSDRRIQRLIYMHNGQRYDSIVGEVEKGIGQEVIAIFEVLQPGPRFLVCTSYRGVAGGGPVMVGDEHAGVVDFDPDWREMRDCQCRGVCSASGRSGRRPSC